jgi:hypothetical protein
VLSALGISASYSELSRKVSDLPLLVSAKAGDVALLERLAHHIQDVQVLKERDPKEVQRIVDEAFTAVRSSKGCLAAAVRELSRSFVSFRGQGRLHGLHPTE